MSLEVPKPGEQQTALLDDIQDIFSAYAYDCAIYYRNPDQDESASIAVMAGVIESKASSPEADKEALAVVGLYKWFERTEKQGIDRTLMSLSICSPENATIDRYVITPSSTTMHKANGGAGAFNEPSCFFLRTLLQSVKWDAELSKKQAEQANVKRACANLVGKL